MGNNKRYFEEGMAYFVTTVTKERKALFLQPKLAKVLLVTMEYYKIILDYKVLGYCLMPDHLHLILMPSKTSNLSVIMKMIKGTFTRKMNKLSESKGSMWQEGYYDEVIRNERQLLTQLEYLHQNPVAAELVSDVSDYPYSSYAQFYGIRNSYSEILEIDKLDQEEPILVGKLQ